MFNSKPDELIKVSKVQESYNAMYFKVIKRLKSRELEPKRASMMELFCEYT